jgi:hypothetical protein
MSELMPYGKDVESRIREIADLGDKYDKQREGGKRRLIFERVGECWTVHWTSGSDDVNRLRSYRGPMGDVLDYLAERIRGGLR